MKNEDEWKNNGKMNGKQFGTMKNEDEWKDE